LKSAITRLVLRLLVAVVMLKALVTALESKFVFFPTRGEDYTPATLGIRYDAVRLRTTDGETLVAWQFEPERPIADVVYFHGNGGNLSVWLPVLATLHAVGLRVLAVDYRGYGVSSGAPSEDGVYLDAAAVAQHAKRSRLTGPFRPLVFWGRSLGGAIAAAATQTMTPDALILESAFPDKAAVIRSNPVLRLLNVLATYRFDTIGMLDNFQNPVLVIHGERDSVVPFSIGRDMFDRLNGSKEFLAISGADHNDLLAATRLDYWQPVLDFIDRLHAR
jgi:fermentation-respiration switch protein FrsA (DUF1100 family)